MRFIKFGKNKEAIASLQEMVNTQASALKTQTELVNDQAIVLKTQGVAFEKQTVELQELYTDVLSFTEAPSTLYTGNEYKTYDKALAAIDLKYRGMDDWGNIQTGNIIDVRSAFIMGQGLNIVENEKKVEKEVEFAEAFLKNNFLYDEMPMEYTKEAEIEGKFLCELKWNEKKKNVDIRFIPFTAYKYMVETDGLDYLTFTKVRFSENNAEFTEILEPNFVYKRFGGRVYEPNKPAMKIWKCLTQINDIDKALRDLREINNLFASPIPHIECENANDAKAANDEIKKIRWNLRKMFAHTGKLLYASPDASSTDMIIKEIETKSKIVSGTTGVPVHFLGFPDLLSNRATADNLLELIWASTTKEREIWEGAYNEALNKAIDIYNDKLKLTTLRKGAVSIKIKSIPTDQILWIKDVYLPALMSGKISLELFLSKIPGVDVEAEKKLLEVAKDEMLEKVKNETILNNNNALKKGTEEELDEQKK